MKVSKDIPLAELTLRKYGKPYNLPEREIVKKLCLSIGLLQPGDSRDVVVDVLDVLLKAKLKNEHLDSTKIQNLVITNRKKYSVPIFGIAPSNIRRQLKRLRDLFLVEKIANEYRITEFEDLHIIFEKRIKNFLLPSILERIEEYFKVYGK
ncbi:hypothetical protein J4468_04290 [Candidatus Woesearchaeota archaeon]|nr:hypothetical protein [Candidatus Woesearchaeota archaeon]